MRCANRMVRHQFERVLHGLELWEQRKLAGKGAELTHWDLFDRFVAEEHRAMKKKHGVTGDLLRDHPHPYDKCGSEVGANRATRQRRGSGSSRAYRCVSAFGERRGNGATP